MSVSVQLTPNLHSLPRFPRLLNTIIPPLNTTEFQQRAASCHEPTSEPKEESQSGKRDLLHGKRDLLYDKREPPKEEGQSTHTQGRPETLLDSAAAASEQAPRQDTCNDLIATQHALPGTPA